MKTIWKFPLEVTDSQEVGVPAGAQILDVQVQGGQPCLWAIVHPGVQTVRRTVRIYGTGHQAPDDLNRADYIGTFQLMGGGLVFHAFIYG
jgi:hypothetical protein